MDKSEKFWNRMAGQFERRANNSKISENKTLIKTKKFLKASDIVLDYGCATGIFSIEIAGCVKKVHGLDFSSRMIEMANRKKDELKIENIDYAIGTIFDCRFEKESFDLLLASHILHLVEDAPKVIQRMNELLKPGGMVITATATMGETKSFIKAIFSFLNKIGLVPRISYYKRKDVEDIITNGNFQIVEIESLNKNNTEYFIAAKKI
jgi:2-polyprenyl-3-methyl-5-hydroxy-6-metoxy-1,4-benzoquinol methylase